MDAAAKKWTQEYKKLFDRVAARNAGMNVVEDVTTVERKEEIKKIGKLVDELGGTATQVPKKVIKKIGKLVPEDKKTASGTKVQDSGERWAAAKQKFREDKYFQRQIDRLDDLKQGTYITVGEIPIGSPLNKIGFPDSVVYFDVSKIIKEMRTRRDVVSPETMKSIPQVLNNPIVITEYIDQKGEYSANVYGQLFVGNSPVVVGVMMKQTPKGNIISKIKTVHPNRDVLKEITDDKILYLSENKKETKLWFQSLGKQELPLRGKQFGFIRSISQKSQNSNSSGKNSSKDFDSGERSALADGKRATAGEVAAVKSSISKKGIDPKGIIAIADKYFARYSGQLTRTGVRYEFLAAADMLFDLTAESGDRAYASVEALAEELVTNEKDTSGMTEDIKEIKRHIREITFDVREWA